MDWEETTARRDEKHLSVVIWCGLYPRFYSNGMLGENKNYLHNLDTMFDVVSNLRNLVAVKLWSRVFTVTKRRIYIIHSQDPFYQYGLTSWWRHEMETFSALLAICAGNSPVSGEFPAHKGQWRGALMSLWFAP